MTNILDNASSDARKMKDKLFEYMEKQFNYRQEQKKDKPA